MKRQRLDGAMERKLSRGQILPEDTLDLHGLYCRDAELRLVRFIEQAEKDRLRTLLVVTGKGTGVLKRAVVTMLSSERFVSRVAYFCPAPRSMGGDGGLMVRLRKRRKKSGAE